MASCTACGASIHFASHVKTRRSMPVDAKPSQDGNLVLFHENDLLMVRHAKFPADQLRPRHKAHFATCPKAGQFRRRRPH